MGKRNKTKKNKIITRKHKLKKTKMFKKNHCSLKDSSKNISCLDNKLLIKIANILNTYHDADIKLVEDRQSLHDNISEKVQNMSKCNSEKCWLTIQELIKHLSSDELSLFKGSFKPKMPDSWKNKPNEWLNTTQLNQIMIQLTEKYKNFHSYQALPMDFDLKEKNSCVSGDLCNIDLKEHFSNGKTNIGIIFNLDDHDEPGSHWTSMYIELLPCCRKEPTIYYFDSTGFKPPKEIYSLVDRLQEQYLSIKGTNMDFVYNDIKHQYKDTECGVYCLHFMSTMLGGVNFEKYVNNIKKDDYIQKYRSYFFI